MKEVVITFNEETERYEAGEHSLHCGDCLEVWNGEEWLSCRVEYSDNWSGGYYLIVFDNEGNRTGTIPLWDKKRARVE